jgi:acetyl-CoA carboxylase biotin carboxylase subunit
VTDIPARPSISRVLIANRGEIALRAVRACRAIGLETVAIFSSADADSPHVWAADSAVCLGPPPSTESYLAIPSVLHVAVKMGCDAVYPGYGFLAENAEFAEACAENNLKFIGPSAEAIRTMGDKARARETAKSFGVPVVPGSDGVYTDAAEAAKAAKGIGFPMLLKARSGGGGRGMRVTEDLDGFSEAFTQATREAEAAFGDGAIYLERFFPKVRHIEVQVLGDGKGNSLQFDERDCSVQRRHQKLVEESPSPAVDEKLRARLLEVSGLLTRGIAYEGAGTVEFIFNEASGEFFFIEMNTRIQVEHPVTEMRTGLDLVELQFRIAAGEPLPSLDTDAMPGGHAIEFRINAEDWMRGFVPSPGRLEAWQPPRGEGIRLDAAVYQGQRITPYYDSMIAKLIVHGRDRNEALSRARDALSGFRCEGIANTIGFHRILVDEDDFIANRIHTRWTETALAWQTD